MEMKGSSKIIELINASLKISLELWGKAQAQDGNITSNIQVQKLIC